MREKLISKFGEDLSSVEARQLVLYVENIAFDECNAALDGLSGNERAKRFSEIFSSLSAELTQTNALDNETAKALLNGAKKGFCSDKEKELYNLIYDYDNLRKKIVAKQKEISQLVEDGYDELESVVASLDDSEKNVMSAALDELSKTSLPLANMLKEASEMAFVNVLENGSDIEDMAHYTAKNIAFYAICDGEFTKFRLKEIAKIIIDRAIFVANESKNIAPALVRGAVLGAYDGITKAAEKYRDDMSVTPDESAHTLEQKKEQIAQMDGIFVAVLDDAIARTEEPAKSAIEKISQEEFGGYLSKFRKISGDLGEQLSEKIKELNLGEQTQKMGEKARELSAEWKQKSEKIIENFELDEKIDTLKKEMGEFEKKMSEKFTELKGSDMAKNVSAKAREIGKKAYESAIEAIKKMKSKVDD